MILSRRSQLALAVVIDIGLHARGMPVAAKALAARHDLAPRQLESVLQALVRAAILKGTRGPRGGYELARERRRIRAGDVVRAVAMEADDPPRILAAVVAPLIAEASAELFARLDAVTVDDLCRRAETADLATPREEPADFSI